MKKIGPRIGLDEELDEATGSQSRGASAGDAWGASMSMATGSTGSTDSTVSAVAGLAAAPPAP